ncbi:MAG: UDP-3-O-(3-hydroxymyristoyl)glucosamine N-acyltransferase [Pseudomonadota bacterium]
MELTLGELAALLGGRLEGPTERKVSGIKGIEEAGPADLAFLANPKYARFLATCRAGVVLVKPDQATPPELAVIRLDDPYLAFAKVLTFATRRPPRDLGVHPQAVVEASAKLGAQVSIHALAYVGEGAVIGDRAEVHPQAYVGPGAVIGADTVLHPGVKVYHGCRIGARCIIHGGTIIGADGYGFVPEGDRHFKIPQVGIVQIDDDVELGALNTVDRAATGRTWIKAGVKTDDHVHVAHNCVVGVNTLLVAQVGISGSTKVGDNVIIAGQAGVGGHLNIGDRAIIGPQSGVAKDVEAGAVVSGTTVMPHQLWLRTRLLIQRLPDLFQRVAKLEKRTEAGS